MLSVACITDSSRLLADLKLCVYRPSRLGIALSRNYLQINGQGESISGVSGKQAAAPKASIHRPIVKVDALITITHAGGSRFAR